MAEALCLGQYEWRLVIGPENCGEWQRVRQSAGNLENGEGYGEW